MKSLQIEKLTLEKFREFGVFRNMFAPSAEKIGEPPIEFYRDMIQQTLGGNAIVSYSSCIVGPREMIIDVSEFHTYTAEMLMPLDADVLMYFAPAGVAGEFPADKARVFLVPKGTMVVIKPGTWHHGPFCLGDEPVSILVALPERTYANDCAVITLGGDARIAIDRVNLPTSC